MATLARVRALAAYKDFLTLWKEPIPDVPILKQAKAEHAKRGSAGEKPFLTDWAEIVSEA
jgi:hypothetical protein